MTLTIKARLHRLMFDVAVLVAERLAGSAEQEIQWSPALGYWSMVAARRPREAAPRAHQLALLCKLGRSAEAVALALSWVPQFKTDAEFLQAASHAAARNRMEALATIWMTRAAEVAPDRADIVKQALRMSLRLGRDEDALRLLTAAQARGVDDPVFAEARLRLALRKPMECDVTADVACLVKGGRLDLIRSLARDLGAATDRQAALVLAQAIISGAPGDGECIVAALRVLARCRDVAVLEKGFQAVAPDVRDTPLVMAEYGRALVGLGFTERGLAVMEQARSRAPEDDTILHALAGALHGSLHWSRALPLWEDLRQRRPKSIEPIIRMIDALIETGEYDRALAVADEAIALRGRRNDLLEWRGRVTFASSRWEESLAEWRDVLEAAPSRPAPWYYVGMAGIRANALTVEEALDHFSNGLARHPRHPRLLEKHAQVAERAGEYEVSLQSWRELLELQGDNRAAWNGVARELMLLGRRDEARAHLADMGEFDPASVHPQAAGALIDMLEGDVAAARAGFEAALSKARERLDHFLERNKAEGYGYAPTLDGEVWVDHPGYRENTRKFCDFVDQARARRNAIIVGNSSNLIGKGLGEAIDGHDLIVRLNAFQLEGFEADTGSRTDHWMSALGVQHREAPVEVAHVQALICYMRDFHFGETGAVLKRVMGLSTDQVTVLPNFGMQLLNDLTYFYPSTGLRALMFYRLLGLPVTICGFDFFTEKVKHYYEAGKEVLWASESHSVLYEYKFVFDMLAPLGQVRTLTPTTTAEPLRLDPHGAIV